MSELQLKDWKLEARAVVQLCRKKCDKSVSLSVLSMTKYTNFVSVSLGHMKKFRSPDYMHNRNVAQRKQFVVILTKIPENPKPNCNRNYMPYRTSTTNVLCHYAITPLGTVKFCHFILFYDLLQP